LGLRPSVLPWHSAWTRKGQAVAAFGYGAGEGIAQAIQITSAPPKSGTAGQIAGESIDLGTYYRWTRRRQQEPH
jgi:hypothetical protein